MIEIIEKTKDYVIIYKPSGIPSQSDPSGDKDAMTLLSERLREMGEEGGLYLVHRLDRVVGGLLVYARNKTAAAALSALSGGGMRKEYFAVVEGEAKGGVMRDFLYKDASLGKAFITNRKRAGVKECELEYTTLDCQNTEKGPVSLVRVKLITGRFHQIRAQFSSRKMPLIGDKKYGSHDIRRRTPSLFASRLSFEFKGKAVATERLPDLNEYPWSLFEKEKYTL